MGRVVAAVLAVGMLVSGAAFAADAGMAGTWAFKSRGRIVMLLRLQDGSGVLRRPRRASFAGGEAVSGIELPVISVPLQVTSAGPGALRIREPDPSNPGAVDVLDFRQTGPDRAALTIEGAPIAALPFVRVNSEASVDPEVGRPAPAEPDNAEMTRIFDADQAARQGDFLSIDWKTVSKADADRRAQVRDLIQRGELQSANDFVHASFIFQHGDTADDFLFAHTLALIALGKGSDQALWIAAATLDRYLQKIGQPQIYGTQFRVQPDKSFTQAPYDRSLISDQLRAVLGVPDQAAQQTQRKAYGKPAKAP